MVELVWYVTLVWQGVSVECGFVKYADEMPRHSSCRSTSHNTSWNEDLAIAVALLNQTVNLVCHGHQSLSVVKYYKWHWSELRAKQCYILLSLNSGIIILEEAAIWYSKKELLNNCLIYTAGHNCRSLVSNWKYKGDGQWWDCWWQIWIR